MSKNIFSNEAFAEFCERQGDKPYQYFYEKCAIGQYLEFCGLDIAGVGGDYFRLNSDPDTYIPLSKDWEEAALERPANFTNVAKYLRARANAI